MAVLPSYGFSTNWNRYQWLSGWLLPILLAVSLTSSLIGQVASSNRTAKESKLISVRGVVVDEDDRPIDDAVVYLREWAVLYDSEEDDGRRNIFHSKRKYTFAKTKTDQGGNFQFSNVKSPPANDFAGGASRWSVVAQVPGRSDVWFKLVKPQTDEFVRLVSLPGTTIEGIVRDRNGQPISDVEVYVDEISHPNSRRIQLLKSPNNFIYRNSELSPRATTDAQGKFLISDVPTERRLGVVFLHDGFVPQLSYVGTTKQLQPPLKNTITSLGKKTTYTFKVHSNKIQMEMVKGHRLIGRIVAEKVEGVANQEFELRHASGEEIRLITDANGNFESPRFRESIVRLRVGSPNIDRFAAYEEDFQFAEGEVEKRIEFQLPVASTVRGTLKSVDSQPIPNAQIVFVPGRQKGETSILKSTTTATTDDSGEFEMRVATESGILVPIGQVFGFELSTMDQIHQYQMGELKSLPESWMRIESDFFDPSDENQTRVANCDLIGVQAKMISGRILNVQGEPVVGATIDVVDGVFEWNGPFRRMNRMQIQKLFRTKSNERGTFRVIGIPRESNAVFSVVDPQGSEVALIYFKQLKTLTNVNVKLKKGVELTGKVKMDGKPRSNATVFLNVIGNYSTVENGRSSLEQFHWGTTKTDVNGVYRFSGLPAKPSYFVSVRIHNHLQDSRNPKLEEASKIIEVPDFEFKSLDSSVSGFIVDLKGNPVAGAEVSARDAKTGRTYEGTSSNRVRSRADGSFRIGGLPAETDVTIRAFVNFKIPAEVQVTSGDENVRLKLDPNLAKKPRKIGK